MLSAFATRRHDMAELIYRGVGDREEAVAYQRVKGLALGLDPPRDIERIDDEPLSIYRVVTVDGQLAGGLDIYDDWQWFGGRAIRSWGSGSVGVGLHHRRRGVGRALMLGMLREARASGVPLSVLFASTPAFYRGVGYEPAGWTLGWAVDPACFPRGDGEAEVVLVEDEAGRGRVRAVYERWAAGHNGVMGRCDRMWRRWYRPKESERYAYVIVRGGSDEGYLIVHRDREQGALWINVATLTPGAAAGAAGFAFGLTSVVKKLRWLSEPVDPLRYQIADHAARPGQGTGEWLMRLTDVDAALAQRGYPAVHAELHLDVRDGAMPENAGRRVLSVRGGEAGVQPGGSGRISLDVRALTAIFTGHATPTEMRALGWLAGPTEDVAAMGRVFAGPRPFMIDEF